MKTIRTLIIVTGLMALLVGAVHAETGNDLFQKALVKQNTEGNLTEAIKIYQTIVQKYGTDHKLAARALNQMADCHQKLGDAEAKKIYERVLRDFGDQKEAVNEAQTRLAALQPATSAKQPGRQVWSGDSVTNGWLSPDGRYLGLTDKDGNVAIRDFVTGTNRRLTNTGGWPSGQYTDAPVISPDGRQVAYVMYIDKENTVELRVASIADGESARPQVVLRTDQNEGATPISWMPDGKQLLVNRYRQDKTRQIGIMTIQDGAFRSIKSLEWRKPNKVSLSPDARYVAYDIPAGEAGSPHDIFVLATDGSRETAVVQNPADDSSPLWSPDGSQLVFLSDRTGSIVLWTVPIKDGRANGPAVSIRTDVSRNLMGLTKSGTLYYFARTGGSPRNLYVADLDGTNITKPPQPATERLINTNSGGTWSRDGEYLAYYSFRGTSIQLLVIRTARTGEERTVRLPPRVTSRFGAGPKWFPGNNAVLVESGDAQGAGFGFYRLSLDSGNTELLTHLPRDATTYDLSPDGRTIFYALYGDDGQHLMRFDIDSRRETDLRYAPFAAVSASPGWEIVAIAVSPDGMQLATTLIGGIVEVRPVSGGQSREVFRPKVSEMGTGSLREALAWMPDQRFLLFAQDDNEVWKVPTTGGEASKMGISGGYQKSLSVRPDGKQIIFDAPGGGGSAAIWALDNFLPTAKAAK